MTNSPSNTQSQTVPYFNAHTEGLGYLDSLVHVAPKPGQDFEAFWSASFCMLEGNPQKPEKTYVSLTVPSDKALENLLPFAESINGQTTKVFVGLRLAKFRGKPFVYAPDSQTPGKLGINYSARLIAVLYLKVGDSVINLKREDQQTTTDFGVPAAIQTPRNTEVQKTEVIVPSVDSTYVVALSKEGISTQEFEVTKARLKDNGYRWYPELKLWALPTVRLEKNDPDFQLKMAKLKSYGYRWNKVAWELLQSKPQQTNTQANFRASSQTKVQQLTYPQH